MKIFDLKLGYLCNNRCSHCVISENKEGLIDNNLSYNLSFRECELIIEKMVLQGIEGIVLTGGEPTIFKDLDKILLLCEKHKLWITMQTNGRKLMRSNLKQIYPTLTKFRALIALHGATAKTHDEITQTNRSFKQTCENIEEYFSSGFNGTIKVVLSKGNMNELADIVRLTYKLGGEAINFAYPHGLGDAKKNFLEIAPTYHELQPFLFNVIEVARELGVQIEFEAIPFCIIPQNLTLVSELHYRNYKTLCNPVKEEIFDWDNVRISIKKKAKGCQICSLDKICEGPWSEYIDHFGDKDLVPLQTDNPDFLHFLSQV